MSQSSLTILKVWIEPGCIVCNACESDCPEVFHVGADGSTVRAEAIDVEFLRPLSDAIRQAAEECPVEVIKFEASDAGPEKVG